MEPVGKTPFLAFTRICLNNWHYISRKTLTLDQEINFFTGHSGSGKSTVIDALQIVLYANTDGRGFFNKAAADDSDRSLIEYLRGMVTIGDNNEFSYLRNQNFSSAIVLELTRTDTGDAQCVGVVFDVDTATNDISRRFFRHKGPLWENEYRTGTRAMSISEIEAQLAACYSKEDYLSTSHNERFRRFLYDSCLGGLDSVKFPLLFKRAIPFRMNIRLEDFVKEYICTETDIHIEDMQESVMQYGRMRQKIEDTARELSMLSEIRKAYEEYREMEGHIEKYTWFTRKLDLMDLKEQLSSMADRIRLAGEDAALQKEAMASTDAQIQELTEKSDGLLRQIASTGYEELKSRLTALNELAERLGHSEARWQRTAQALKQWEEEEITSNQTLWDIEEFENGALSRELLDRLKKSLSSMHTEIERQRQETAASLRELERQEGQLSEELAQLKAGSKAYPRYLEQARSYIQRRLLEETGQAVEVYVLADLLDVPDEGWRNAVEGYLANHKLNLVVPPKYAGSALALYGELDKKTYCNVSVLDTEKLASLEVQAMKNSLAEEVTVRESYLKPYITLLLGKVIKCSSVSELRRCHIGVTKDCLLYHTLRLKYIDPEHYTKYAYIGKDSLRRRIRLLEKELAEASQKKLPLEFTLKDCRRLLDFEYLSGDTGEYLQWREDMDSRREKLAEKKQLTVRLKALMDQNINQLEEERAAIAAICDGKKRERDKLHEQLLARENERTRLQSASLQLQETIREREAAFTEEAAYRQELEGYLKSKDSFRYDRERSAYESKCQALSQKRDSLWDRLLALRSEYMRCYPGRNVPLSSRDNDAYDRLETLLGCDRLEEYRAQAARQARAAAEHFKDDFMYKIRSAIKDALVRKDELNRIISRLDFGKDKYQFVIGKNRGADGRYFDMFMDEALEINPSQLSPSVDNQMNLFTMEHESQYSDRINELISIFIPPEQATPEQQEEARKNMEKYADYRTYLSFDMEQLIQNEDEVIKIRLSRMLKKNSGGEGQNPLYVALLASFAQAYRISQSPGVRKHPTIRLVVLDEAFSKMDAEKVASCIELIRGLGFQAIISATNDKIQNYIENVDKTFVFANPSKRAISIQEFSRERLPELVRDLDEE